MADKDDPVQVKIRIREETRATLEKQAADRGVSLNAEVSARLERSLDRQALLPEVLSLLFPGKLPGLLLALGLIMKRAGRDVAPGDWTSDPKAFAKALDAATNLLFYADPDRGERLTKEDYEDNLRLVSGFVQALKDDKKSDFEHIPAVLELLGPVVRRLQSEEKARPTGPAWDFAIAMTRAAGLMRIRIRQNQDTPPPIEFLAMHMIQQLREFLPIARLKELLDEGQHHPEGKGKLENKVRHRDRRAR